VAHTHVDRTVEAFVDPRIAVDALGGRLLLYRIRTGESVYKTDLRCDPYFETNMPGLSSHKFRDCSLLELEDPKPRASNPNRSGSSLSRGTRQADSGCCKMSRPILAISVMADDSCSIEADHHDEIVKLQCSYMWWRVQCAQTTGYKLKS